jgi:hypothetical protein
VSVAAFFRRLKRGLTPPGNRPPIEEAGDTNAAPTGLEPPSPGGNAVDRWDRA